MIITNLFNLENEIAEVANEYGVAFDIILNASFFDRKMGVVVEFEGKKYNYEYDLTYSTELERKRYVKRFAKLSCYKALKDHFGYSMPWGALTGIRPTKLAYQQGENWKNFFLDTMLVSESKTQLVEKILEAQKGLLPSDKPFDDLFIGIPFCPTRCAYCSFLSCELGREKHVNEYIAALLKEIEAAKAMGKKYRSLYIGGGTPVSLSDSDFEKVICAAAGDYIEFTVEAGRPDCITETKLEIMKRYGVTRVCVNPQTFSDKTLALIGRRHTAEDVVEKYRLVKRFGFEVNMDLIAGLPEESFDGFKYSLEKAISLDPENITVHTLCLKKGSRLKESEQRLSVDDIDKMVAFAHASLQNAGYVPYYLYRQKYMAGNLENTGYAKPGHECAYNVDIMEEVANIVACGANAISKRIYPEEERIERLSAPKDIKTYIEKVDALLEEKYSLFS